MACRIKVHKDVGRDLLSFFPSGDRKTFPKVCYSTTIITLLNLSTLHLGVTRTRSSVCVQRKPLKRKEISSSSFIFYMFVHIKCFKFALTDLTFVFLCPDAKHRRKANGETEKLFGSVQNDQLIGFASLATAIIFTNTSMGDRI